MDRANKLKKLRDEENEERYGFVHGVSGPGMEFLSQIAVYFLLTLILIMP